MSTSPSLPSNVTVINDAVAQPLPKWPGLIVQGTPVTPEQANEILIRTDGPMPEFGHTCNAHETCRELAALFGIPEEPSYDLPNDERMALLTERWAKLDALTTALRKVPDLSYLSNHQIASAWIGGPHGWCDWDGIIKANTFNIGKWPSVEEVAREWAAIAEAFPYLNLTAWLHDGETCQMDPLPVPVVRFEVTKGTVRAVRQADEPGVVPTIRFSDVQFNFFMEADGREIGMPPHQLSDRLKEVYGTIPQYGTV